jgi:hypothetical protein
VTEGIEQVRSLTQGLRDHYRYECSCEHLAINNVGIKKTRHILINVAGFHP